MMVMMDNYKDIKMFRRWAKVEGKKLFLQDAGTLKEPQEETCFQVYKWVLSQMICKSFFKIFIELTGITLVKTLYKFQVYNFIIWHLYTLLCSSAGRASHSHHAVMDVPPPWSIFQILVMSFKLNTCIHIFDTATPFPGIHSSAKLLPLYQKHMNKSIHSSIVCDKKKLKAAYISQEENLWCI